MFKNLLTVVICVFSLQVQGSTQETTRTKYRNFAPKVEALYRHLHQNPELSGKEFKTSKKMAQELRQLGYTVTENIGGTGLVGVLKNGPGPTLWLRADMDGLPMTEDTGKSYASKTPGVMHGCGHDVHMASMIGYAHVLKETRNLWRGTIVMIGQPAEEISESGAKAMIDDGLYKKFPKPDFVLGLHVAGTFDAGEIRYTDGYALAAADAFDIEVSGVGGHASMPHRTVDPVVLASKIILNAQTLVSRNTDPGDPIVLTFGSIHGGTKHNIIPDTVHLQGTLRTYSKETRTKVIAGLKRTAEALALAEGAPKPKVEFENGTPSTFNNSDLTQRILPVFKKVVGAKNVRPQPGIMGAEDFSYYAQNGKYPTLYFFVGGAPKNKKRFAPNHSERFAPEYKKSLQVGVETMALAVMELAGKEQKL